MRKHLSWLLIIVPFLAMVIANLLAQPHVGDTIPIHWNWRGEADSWGGKGAVWILPGIFVWCAGLIGLISLNLPGSGEVTNPKAILWLQAGLGALFLCLQGAMLTLAVQASKVLAFALMNKGFGVFMLALGLSFKYCQRNSFIGIRTKWTLESEVNWEKTHRFASSAFNIAGVWLIFFAYDFSFLVTVGVLLAITLLTVGYSYRLHKAGERGP